MATPAGPIRRERSWTEKRIAFCLCSAVAQIPIPLLITPMCVCSDRQELLPSVSPPGARHDPGFTPAQGRSDGTMSSECTCAELTPADAC
ncbi:hypothetical protein VZT92_007711 [Zoarces viviparus]|uniref:Uncharacterized protein n=1 Tax=Zoarces viviparus TaxID=48416 RepID=A0AAW1FKF7_ZOAVI